MFQGKFPTTNNDCIIHIFATIVQFPKLSHTWCMHFSQDVRKGKNDV